MKHNFKVGDKVRVVKRVEWQNGWDNAWVDAMDNTIGHEFEIKEISHTGVYFQRHSGSDPVKNDMGYTYGFPSDSLELVEETVEGEIMKHNFKADDPKHNFKVGDKVRVVKRVETQDGWRNVWVDEMDFYIGKQFTIGDISSRGGVYFDVENYSDFSDDEYGFPTDALELVSAYSTLEIINAWLGGADIQFLSRTGEWEDLDLHKFTLRIKPNIDWVYDIPPQGILCKSTRDGKTIQVVYLDTPNLEDWEPLTDQQIKEYFRNL